MLHELVADPGERSPGELLAGYREALRDAVEAAGRERAAGASGLEHERIDALAAGEPVELTLSEAAALLAAAEGGDAEAIAAEAREHLLMGMTTAVLDVDTIAANLEGDVSPTGIQQRIEGRAEMTLEEYARLHAFVAGRQP